MPSWFDGTGRDVRHRDDFSELALESAPITTLDDEGWEVEDVAQGVGRRA